MAAARLSRELAAAPLHSPRGSIAPCCGSATRLRRSHQFDHRQLSRPRDMNEATQRVTYNARNFSGNYLLIVVILAVWAL